MALVPAFGVVPLISVSLSGVAARTVLSTALLFLLAGALLGQGPGPPRPRWRCRCGGRRCPAENAPRPGGSGPRGFVSVVYGLFAPQPGIPDAGLVFDLVTVRQENDRSTG